MIVSRSKDTILAFQPPMGGELCCRIILRTANCAFSCRRVELRKPIEIEVKLGSGTRIASITCSDNKIIEWNRK